MPCSKVADVQLRSLTLKGFRRFADTWVNLEGNVVAIVGPNEAGKSSILEALSLLNDDEPIRKQAVNSDVRSQGATLTLRLRLNDDDRRSIGVEPGDTAARWLIVEKRRDGPRQYTLAPVIVRPRRPRKDSSDAVKSMLADEKRSPTLDDEARARLEALAIALGSNAADLPAETITALHEAVEQVASLERGEGLTKAQQSVLKRLGSSLDATAEVESRPNSVALARTLSGRVPQFLTFDTKDRELRTANDLAESPEDGAFTNLLAAAGLNRQALLNAIQADESGRIKDLIDSAESTLTRIMQTDWSQDRQIRVGIDRKDTQLRLVVSSSGAVFHALQDRSDGFRTFIALRVFLEGWDRKVPPVLLVDEAETHLHYDAQADLLRMFEQQRDAASVIYTTHSVGCLPQDIGRGVRAVIPGPGARSVIENAWMQSGHGVTPLLRAMGATSVQLAPARHVVFCEGPADPLILPSLLREARPEHGPPFQMVGRLSEASRPELARMSDEAVHVAFLVDGDESGREIAKTLKDLGVKTARIVTIPGGRCVEDLLDASRYVDAINTCLHAWGVTDKSITAADIGVRGRPAAVSAWARKVRVKDPSHLNVAAEVLRAYDEDESPDRRLLDKAQAKVVRALYAALLKALGISEEDAALYRP
ncbi:MAG: AAA family ATPase [Chloroflexota bacterium]